MKKKLIIIMSILALQIGCSSKKAATQDEVAEVEVTLPGGSKQSLKYSLNQTSEKVTFKMDISNGGCAHFAVDIAKASIKPTYDRTKTVEDLGDIVVKSSYFKDEYSEDKFAFSNHQYRYVYFVADDTVKKSCQLSAPKNISKIAEDELTDKLSTLPTVSSEMNLSPELAQAMVGSANYLTYYISVKIGSDDNFRLILKSDDLSVVGLAVHMPILGYEDVRSSYLNRYQDRWDAPEAMPLPFVGKDVVRIFEKDNFVFRLAGDLKALSGSYSTDYLISLVNDESKEFGGK